MNLIWSVPVGVLLASGVIILLINRGSSNIGASWFIAILAGVFAWGWTVYLYFRPDITILPLSEVVSAYSGQTAIPGPFYGSNLFVLDGISYPYMTAISALLVFLLLTSASYIEAQTAPRVWFFYLLIAAIGYLSVSANDVRFIIYGWVVFDAIDMAVQYIRTRPNSIPRSFLSAVGVRFVGTLLAASSLALSISESPSDFHAFISLNGGAYLFTACALRMGIMPVSQPYSEMSDSRAGLGMMLRLVSVLTVMPVMSRIPLSGLQPNLVVLLFIAGSFASLTGAIGWLLSGNSISGITYAVLAICGMTFICALRGNQEALIVWGVSIALTCAPLAIYQVRNTFMNVLAFMVVLCFSGLPYTPNAIGWFGLVHEPFMLQDAVFIIVMIFLIGGSVIHVFRSEGRKFSELEPWMRSVYPIGFVAVIATHVFIGVISFRQPFSLGVIPGSVAAFLGGIMLPLSLRFMPESRRTQNAAAWGQALISFFWNVMQRLMDMDWLLFIGSWCGRFVRKVFLSLSSVLENNGGLIWEFLLLLLLVAAVFGGGLL
ncbi:MAG: hypothetical protein IJI57_14100 [Flexilinea sp.]|nr:hypothetical protein [Flexilinea sp.]